MLLAGRKEKALEHAPQQFILAEMVHRQCIRNVPVEPHGHATGYFLDETGWAHHILVNYFSPFKLRKQARLHGPCKRKRIQQVRQFHFRRLPSLEN